MVKRAKRADLRAALLVAPEIAPAGYRLPRCHRLWFAAKSKSRLAQPHRVGFSYEDQRRFRKGAFG